MLSMRYLAALLLLCSTAWAQHAQFVFLTPQTVKQLPVCASYDKDSNCESLLVVRYVIQEKNDQYIRADVWTLKNARYHKASLWRFPYSTYWLWLIEGDGTWVKLFKDYEKYDKTVGPLLALHKVDKASNCGDLSKILFNDVTEFDSEGKPQVKPLNKVRKEKPCNGQQRRSGTTKCYEETQPARGKTAKCDNRWYEMLNRWGSGTFVEWDEAKPGEGIGEPEPRTEAQSEMDW